MRTKPRLDDHEIDRFAAALRKRLDARLEALDEVVCARLSAARHQALARLSAAAEPAPAPAVLANGQGSATIAGGPRGGFGSRLADWRFWLIGAIVSVLFAMYGVERWREHVALQRALDVDVRILGDEVPVDALLDRGFGHFVQEGE
ncbi:MAG: DUF3619 family protein [Casimicrobiaceae bacterium]|nr:DUF3619 family protein [Casimicrobiaceae bacterium]